MPVHLLKEQLAVMAYSTAGKVIPDPTNGEMTIADVPRTDGT